MAELESNIYSSKSKKLEKVLLVLLPLLLLASVILIYLVRSELGGILAFLSILTAILFAWISRKYYNWTLVCLILVVMAIIFRSQRWPLAGIWFTLGFTGLACVSFYSSIVFYNKYNHNTFLKYIGLSSSIILIIISLGLLWKNMHWPWANMILNIGLGVFIPFLFAFIFTLPGSNYINWTKAERIIFFRAIIVPMTFVYVLSFLMFVFPDIYRLMTRAPLLPFNMLPPDIFDKMLIY